MKVVVVNMLNKLNKLVFVAGNVAALTSVHLPINQTKSMAMINTNL